MKRFIQRSIHLVAFLSSLIIIIPFTACSDNSGVTSNNQPDDTGIPANIQTFSWKSIDGIPTDNSLKAVWGSSKDNVYAVA